VRYVERTSERHPYIINYLPFGAGQFQNGETGKGWAFLATEATFATASLTLWIVKHEIYPDDKVHLPDQSEGGATALQLARIMTGSAFFALWAVGAWDAVKHWTPTQIIESPLVPMPIPTQGGLSLGWQGRF
jgi:hypothetical protein